MTRCSAGFPWGEARLRVRGQLTGSLWPLLLAPAALAQTGAPPTAPASKADSVPPPALPQPAPPALESPASDGSAISWLGMAENAMMTLDYRRCRNLAARAVSQGGLDRDDLGRAYRLMAVAAAQLEDVEAAEQAFLRLFALEPGSNIAQRLAPTRRSAMLNARGFWSVHRDAFGIQVSYARRDRQVIVRVRDAIRWSRTVHLWWRASERRFKKTSRPVSAEVVFDLEEVGPIDAVEVYAFVVDECENVLMQFGRGHSPHVFQPSEEELQAVLRRDIRGGQTGSYALRLEEYGVRVGVHGYASLELKPLGDVASFDLHHATVMIRADLLSRVSVEFAMEWEHIAVDPEDFYFPHVFLDLKASDLLVVRAGFFEAPVGAFNEYLYPDFLRITGLPPLFAENIVPALWSEVGLQLRGRWRLARPTYLTYAAFVSNGLEQPDSQPADGVVEEGGEIRAMRFNDRDQFSANKAVGGRLGLEIGDFDLGVSGYTGRYTIEQSRRLSLADVDLSWRSRWLTLRAEAAVALQEVTDRVLRKRGLYALVATRPLDFLEPYLQYEVVDLGPWMQRAFGGVALYPFPGERATHNLRLKNEAGVVFRPAGERDFVWFFQLTAGF